MVRVKHRYVVLSLGAHSARELNITTEDIFLAVRSLSKSMLDDWEYADVVPGLRVAEYYPYTRVAIVKVASAGLAPLLRVIKHLTSIRDYPCTPEIVKVTGIIKKAKQWLVKNG